MNTAITLLAASLLVPLAALHAADAPKQKPNIILILADDMGWADSTPYGSTYYETPALERLAKEGMRFTDAYAASPLCSPTRASIMSGQYPARLRLTEAITGRGVEEPESKPAATNVYCGEVGTRDHMPAAIRTLAEALKEAGYQTAHIGKWHLSKPGGPDKSLDAGKRGFDFVIGGDHLPSPPDYYSPYRREQWFIPNLEPGPEGEYLNDRLAQESVRWLERVKGTGKPFYLNLWHFAVHTPVVAKKDLLPKYQAKRDPRGLQECPEMATMIESLDTSVGMVLDWLDKPENAAVKANTVLIFTSDNGGVVHEAFKERPYTSNVPLRGGKANTYEGGIREPWIVSWPGHVKPGSVCDTPVCSIDIYPTVLAVAGLQPEGKQPLDGVNLLPLLQGKLDGGKTFAERPLFFDFPHLFSILCAPCSAVRKGDYKLLRFFWAGEDAKSHHYELFDLRRDVSERFNLTGLMPEKVAELDALIERHLKETGALVPIPNTAFKGTAARQTRRGNARLTAENVRPLSVSLPEPECLVQKTGRKTVQLVDGRERPIASVAMIVDDGGGWVRVNNLPDGQVEIVWDKELKVREAVILLAWRINNGYIAMNDWTHDPCRLVVK